jgi:hypothetical protein
MPNGQQPGRQLVMPDKRSVRTLIGHKHLDVGLQCLASLLRFSSEPIRLLIHDDGTLTAADRETLVADLPGSGIVTRAEADAIVQPLLKRYPKCHAYRERHPLALKLIDMALLESDELAYCDSDVFFLRRHTGLFAWPNAQTGAMFMQDIQDAYSLRPWHVYPIGQIRMPRRTNSGLIFFRRAAYDLDFVEWLLGQQKLEGVFAKRAHWIEQTCWAALGWRAGCYLWSAGQFIIATQAMTALSDEIVGIHFVAAARSKLNDFLKRSYGSSSSVVAPILIRSLPARMSSPLHMLGQDLANRLHLN